MNPHDMQRVLAHLKRDPVVKAVYDAKSEEIGPNIFRFKAEIGARLGGGRAVCGAAAAARSIAHICRPHVFQSPLKAHATGVAVQGVCRRAGM